MSGSRKSAEPADELQVVDHQTSPTFPRRQGCNPPRLERMPSESSDITDVTTATSTSKSDTVTSDESKSPRRRLHFKGPGGIMNMVSRKRTTSQCSSTEEDSKASTPHAVDPKSPIFDKGFKLDTPGRSPRPSNKRGNVDSTVVGQKGEQYYLAPKDVSVIERISQRAQKREKRVRKPHEVFVELEELRTDPSEELEWEETARWIKFEEDVEEGTGRWGRPHISALTFHSLADLQHGLDKGCVLLDVGGEDFPTIASEIVSSLVLSDMIPQKAADSVLRILLRKHKHRSDTTFWDRLKQSARDPDGRLHHIGEGIRHRLSLANTVDTSEVLAKEAANGGARMMRGKEYQRSHSYPAIKHVQSDSLDLGGTHSHSADAVRPGDRSAHVPLLGNESPAPTPAHDKKVVFNVSPSLHSLDSPLSDTAPVATDTTRGTHSNSRADAVIDMEPLNLDSKHAPSGIEQRRSPTPMDDIDSKEELKASSGGGSSSSRQMHRIASTAALMNKIPDEAESLTVLVGGVKFLQEPVNVFVRLAQSQSPGDLTEVPVPLRFIFLLIGPENGDVNYHEVGRAMATIMSDKHFHEVAYSATNRVELLEGIRSFLDDSLVLPPGDWDEELLLPVMHQRNEERRRRERKQEEAESRKMFAVDPIKHSCRPLGGIIRDFKTLGKRYFSDFRDCLSWQVFISIIFLYIAFVAPAIAFGGLMEEVTLDLIGESETLLATGLCGIVFGLFSVQPIAVLAFTGPLLLFEEIIHENAERFHIDYLPWRAVIGLWVMVILLGLALSEATFVVHYFTRFSEEVFTCVVAIFFIGETIRNIVQVFERNPLCGFHQPCGPPRTNTCVPLDNTTANLSAFTFSGSGAGDMQSDNSMVNCMLTNLSDGMLPQGFRICDQPNTALFSAILCVATFGIAVALRKFRNKKFFGKKGRRIVSDFGMLTALVIMVIVARLLSNHITVETLTVFEEYDNSNCNRGWLINPFTIGVGEGFGAVILAILLAMLIFIENQLGLLHVNKPEHKLKKGVGYHLDLAIVAVLTGVCAILGIPFVCVASVRSLQHFQALSVFSNKNAPGEKPRLVYVHEQRVTNIAVHILILLTPLAYQVLGWVPFFVALGVFPYLSYASLKGVQLTARSKLLFIPPKHHPDVHYVRRVRTLKMHLFTLIQLVLVAILFGIKLSPAGLVYPLAISLTVPIRLCLKKFIFSEHEMEMLDSEEDYPEDHDEGYGEFGEFEDTRLPY